MARFFKSIGKAFCYFLDYFGMQLIVMFAYCMVEVVRLSASMTNQGEVVDVVGLLIDHLMANSLLLTVVAGVLTLLSFWGFFAIRKKSFLKEIGVRSFNTKGIIPIIILGLGFNLTISAAYELIPFPEAWVESYLEASSLIEGSTSWVLVLGAVISAPIVEEVVFRGLIYTRLKQGMPAVIAAILTSLLFGAMHGTIIWLFYTFVLSVALIILFEKYHSLLANILLHLAFNGTNIILAPVLENESIHINTYVYLAIGMVLFLAGAVWNYKVIKKSDI